MKLPIIVALFTAFMTQASFAAVISDNEGKPSPQASKENKESKLPIVSSQTKPDQPNAQPKEAISPASDQFSKINSIPTPQAEQIKTPASKNDAPLPLLSTSGNFHPSSIEDSSHQETTILPSSNSHNNIINTGGNIEKGNTSPEKLTPQRVPSRFPSEPNYKQAFTESDEHSSSIGKSFEKATSSDENLIPWPRVLGQLPSLESMQEQIQAMPQNLVSQSRTALQQLVNIFPENTPLGSIFTSILSVLPRNHTFVRDVTIRNQSVLSPSAYLPSLSSSLNGIQFLSLLGRFWDQLREIWYTILNFLGIGVQRSGSLINRVGGVSANGFDTVKDTFDNVKEMPIMKTAISPVRHLAEKGLDTADEAVTGSLYKLASSMNSRGLNLQKRALQRSRYSYYDSSY